MFKTLRERNNTSCNLIIKTVLYETTTLSIFTVVTITFIVFTSMLSKKLVHNFYNTDKTLLNVL